MSTVGGGTKPGPEVLVNPDGKAKPSGDLGLTDQEKEEIEGQERMQALIDKLTSEARDQLRDYEDDYGDDDPQWFYAKPLY